MKIDITSLCFGFKIEKDNDSGTAAWATSIGQAPKDICYIDTKREGLDEIVYGMMYKSHSDFENLKVRNVIGLDKREEPRGDRERMMLSVFEDVYVNNMKVDGIYTLTYEREDTPSHKNRLHICYAKYLTYNGHSNKDTLKEMAQKLGCSEDACWFVTDITIRNQKNLHFTAVVVNPEHSMTYQNSKERKHDWEALIPEIEDSYNNNQIDAHLQQIFYGAPGTGKSHRIKEDEGVKKADEKNLVFRTTFHPDSDYSTFVGAYKPTIAKRAVRNVAGDIVKNTEKEEVYEDSITYSFVPQAFLQAYVAAWNNPEENVYLVIEEINRGNCAQIFGDLFQLLDRDCDGFSEYPIMADNDLKKYLNGKDEDGRDVLTNKDGIIDGKLRLPKNLYIWATMNTSDQSLFPIDSAFKRRWDWVYVPIDTKKDNWLIRIGDNHYSWTDFLEKINNEILTDETAEDKHLGFYFCKAKNNEIKQETFVSKVLFYLWNDVFKVYGIPSVLGSSKDWAYTKFYNPDGKVNEEKVQLLLQKIGVEIASEDDNVDDEDVFEEPESAGQRKETLISIQIPNHPIIKASDSTQFDSFIEALRIIGIPRIIPVVNKLKYLRLNCPVLSTMRYQEIDNNNKGYSYRQEGELFVVKGCKNYTYIRILEDLNEYLSLGLSLETK